LALSRPLCKTLFSPSNHSIYIFVKEDDNWNYKHYGIDDAQRLSRRQSYKKKVIRASRMVEDMPTLFRILYCCGLRPGEVLHLEVGDVDLKKGVLLVRASKNDNDR
jgi:integrase